MVNPVPAHGRAPYISAREIAQTMFDRTPPALRPKRPELPTPEQAAVIEFADPGSALVIAGAGSGKTTTMAQRVVWLVANGIVAPHEILGLTFTRKAAASLRTKVIEQLDRYERPNRETASLAERALGMPTVSTYNAFASRVFQENALVVGREPDAVLLSDAAAWELAYDVARDRCDARFLPFGRSLSAIVKATLALAHGLNDHNVDRQQMLEIAGEFAAVRDLPTGKRSKYALLSDLEKPVQAMEALPLLLELVDEYERRKRAQSYIEYSDQVALAYRAIEKHSDLAELYRQQYRVVLLDEYQDTSVLQAEFLAALFGGQRVMAVGDPFQAIYGWRGASSNALAEFDGQFGNSRVFNLSTSWRNDERILGSANAIAQPLNDRNDAFTVPKLAARPNVGPGTVDVDWLTTAEDEAARVAEWMRQQLGGTYRSDTNRSAAVLFRDRSSMTTYRDALTAAGVPSIILGFEAVLESPEIVDLVAALSVVHDVSAGAELLRLLAGARWRIGLADLQVLQDLGTQLAHEHMDGTNVSKETVDALRASIDDADRASIVDALDYLVDARDDNWRLKPFSPLGRTRLKAAGTWLRTLRRSMTRDLTTSVRRAIHALDLVTELYANPRRVEPMHNVDAFLSLVDDYVATVGQPTLGGLLSWIHSSDVTLTFDKTEVKPERGVVQLLTIHAAKGLEWDVVAIPRMIKDVFPSKAKSTQGGFGFGAVPYAVRGDRDSLPQYSPRGAETQQDVLEGFKSYQAAVRVQHAEEERRVGYVAMTRAKQALLLTGSWYRGTAKNASDPSPLLIEAIAALDLGPDDVAASWAATEAPPRVDAAPNDDESSWPFDPLRGHRQEIETAAAHVAMATPRRLDGTQEQQVLDLLLAERDEGREVPMPDRFRIPASQFHELVQGNEQTFVNLIRPLPQQPYRASRLGTLFHSWVEQHYGATGSVELVDEGLFAEDIDAEPGIGLDAQSQSKLEQFQATFLRSRWAGLRPVAIERELTTMIGGVRFACKLDAVFASDTGTDTEFEIVDWKTGKAPATPEEHRDRALQLALYRIALAKAEGIAPERIRAVLYYVASDTVVAPEELPDETVIGELWSGTTDTMIKLSSATRNQ